MTARGTTGRPRRWQQEAFAAYAERAPRDFLAVATPGSGKTALALRIAADLLDRRLVERVIVVTPTEHLKRQWAATADRAGIALDPGFGSGRARTSREYDGVVVTYAGVGAAALALRVRCERFKTLVVLDEIHHAGDSLAWGEATREAFEPATRRLGLTGTPFRTDANPIPFVTYAPEPDGTRRSVADFTYGYGAALADRVVRPVLFLAYAGDLRWRTSAGDEIAARLGEPLPKDLVAQAWRTALDPGGDWMPRVLAAADERLSEVRRRVPDAGGLVIASDQESARAYARLVRRVAGEPATLVLSDEPSGSRRIGEFAESDRRWMVAVRMVSEGVDIPRLAVGVYATATATPLYFAQAVGRFVRARRPGETASVFVPTVPVLLEHAAGMEVERDHVLGRPAGAGDDAGAAEEELLRRAERVETNPDVDDGPGFEALGSAAAFDRVVYDGDEFGGYLDVDEREFLGIPGLLDPGQVSALLRQRQAAQASRTRTGSAGGERAAGPAEAAGPASPEPTYERLGLLRRELNGLVAAWHHRTGTPHGAVHAELRRVCGGPPAVAASADELQGRIDRIRAWAAERRT